MSKPSEPQATQTMQRITNQVKHPHKPPEHHRAECLPVPHRTSLEHAGSTASSRKAKRNGGFAPPPMGLHKSCAGCNPVVPQLCLCCQDVAPHSGHRGLTTWVGLKHPHSPEQRSQLGCTLVSAAEGFQPQLLSADFS